MATEKLTARDGYNGYAVLELNQVAFPRDGRIEAQLPLDGTTFAKATGVPAEVGMILKVDKAGKCVDFASALGGAAGEVYALNYSTEHMYDERLPQLKNFHMYASDGEVAYRNSPYDDFYPRLGYLAVGDRFTTNAVKIEEGAQVATLLGTFVTADVDGYWAEVETDNDDPVLNYAAPICQVVEVTTCPNGVDPAVKLLVVKA